MGTNMDLLTDEELVDLTRDGDKEAYGILWKRYFSAGMGYASGLVRGDAEDIVVEAYTKILKAIRTGGGPKESFRPYLYSTIRNLSMTNLARANDIVPGLEDASLGTMSTEGEVLSRADSDRISRVFFAMKPAQRQILWLSEVEERPTGEIAKQLGISKTNVSTSAQRARQEFVRLWVQDHVRTDGVKENSEHAYVLAHAGEYLAGKPSDRLIRRMSAHLKTCSECAAKLDDAKTVSGMFRSRLAPVVAGAATSIVLSSGRAMGAELAAPMPRPISKTFPGPGKAVLPVVGGAGVVIVAVLLFVMRSPGTTEEVAPVLEMSPSASAAAPAMPAEPVVPVVPPEEPAGTPSPVATPSAAPEPVTTEQTTLPAGKPAAPTPSAARANVRVSAAPAKPAIVIVAVDTGPSDVCFPTVSGTAQAGSTVRVSGGSASATVRADAGGWWSTPMLTGLAAGTRTVTAVSPDGKQASAWGEAVIVKQPQIAASVNGARLVLMVNRAVPGIPVDVYVDGELVATLTPDGGGEAGVDVAYRDGVGRTVGVRYHPAGCYGPTYTLRTGF